MTNSRSEIGKYFVDEAGDGILFGKRGKVIIETPGCSRFFFLGLLEVPDTEKLAEDLNNLRAEILNDPFLSAIESTKPERKKTAVYFHATDDAPEIRERVFRLIESYDNLRFFVVIKDKWSVLDYVRHRNWSDQDYRYSPTELYDYTVRRLFRDRLHQHDRYDITFAKWRKRNRTEALKRELVAARDRFYEKYGIKGEGSIRIIPGAPVDFAGLQAADYHLWALQRLFEKKQDRYFEFIRKNYRLIIDIDDTRNVGYGEYYHKGNPLSLDAISERL